MRGIWSTRAWWALAGVVTGLAGLAASYLVAAALTIRESPVVAVAEQIVRLTPGPVVEWAISVFGTHDKTVLVAGILTVLTGLFAVAGLLARGGAWRAHLLYLALTAIGLLAVLTGGTPAAVEILPLLVGLVTWVAVLSLLTSRLEREPGPIEERGSRRTFLAVAGGVTAAAVAGVVVGRLLGAGRREVEEARRFLRLDGVTKPRVPAKVHVDVEGISPWMTPEEDFYLIHTAITLPAIEPEDWTLRIHGMVEREVVLTYEDLVRRGLTERWTTLNCVSNEVGGSLIGNAWWSGVPTADVLALAGPLPDADAVKQTSQDGWTCGTPLTALTDDRSALLAVAMNGKPLSIEHGFPVRTVVPGLYGYVSATKWLVDLEVTRFEDFTAFWTDRGWAERGPVKVASRIDVPRDDAEVPAGSVPVGGVAWRQQVGIEAVEVALDGGPWQPMTLGRVPDNDTWVQWGGTVQVEPGGHRLRVRARDKTGEWQTGVVRDVVPDGATGWHEVVFTAT